MKYTFSFMEISYGKITVEAKLQPSDVEVKDAILNGQAYYKNTEHENIELLDMERSP